MDENTQKETKSKKFVLDDLISKVLTSSTVSPKDDVPNWLAILILLIHSLSIPVSIYIYNPEYLTATNYYPNGIHIHKFIEDAIKFKDLLKEGNFNFWNDETALGYPMFMGSPPLSTVFFGLMFLVFESVATPYQLARWLMILIMIFTPLSFYKSSRLIMFSRTQALFVALMSFMIDSELETGIEIQATLKHGLIEQLIGVIMLPIAVSYVYLYFMKIGSRQISPIYILTVCYLTHYLTGIYIVIIAFMTSLFYICKKQWHGKYIEKSITSYAKMYISAFLYSCWWFIPSVISYPYLAGRFRYMKINTLRLTFFASLVNGDLFDYTHTFLFVSCTALIGTVYLIYSVYKCFNRQLIHWSRYDILKLWLLMILTASILILIFNQSLINFFSMMFPLQVDSDNCSFLFVLHFCIILITSFPFECLCNAVQHKRLRKTFKFAFLICVAVILTCSTAIKFQDKTSYIEVKESFGAKLQCLNKEKPNGRMLVHHKLGTGGAWDTTHLPRLTGKPGVFSYTEGHPSGLSLFYVDAITENNISPADFLSHLRLYNIRYMAISINYLKLHELNVDSLKKIMTVDDVHIFQIDPEDEPYGYFEFVRLPGFIDGDLYHINMPVLNSLELYKYDVLLYVNPRSSNEVRLDPMINIQVDQFAQGILPFSLLTSWKLNHIDSDSESAIKNVKKIYTYMETSSNVIAEDVLSNEYHALVDVKDTGLNKMKSREHLLLKITYHPFWRCVYFNVSDSYKLSDYNNKEKYKYVSAAIDHVTPNYISVTLPPGRYHVIFCYRFPGIFKIIAVICIMIFFQNCLQYNIWSVILDFFVAVISKICKIIMASFMAVYRFIIKLYYILIGTDSFSESISSPTEYFSLSIRDICWNLKIFFLELYEKGFVKPSSLKSDTTDFSRKEISASLVDDSMPKEINENTTWLDPSLQNSVTENESGISKSIDSCTCSSLNENSFINKSSDIDMSFDMENVVRSPPTPPKHCKKSLRKKHSRIKHEANDFEFQNNASPILNNIMDSLRENSLSPEKIEKTKSNFKEELLKCRSIVDDGDDKSLHGNKNALTQNLQHDSNNVSSDSLSEVVMDSFYSDKFSTVTLENLSSNDTNNISEETFHPNRSSSPNRMPSIEK